MCQDTYEPICLKLDMMLNTTNVYSWIQVIMALLFIQGHGVSGNLELHSVVKLHEAAQMFMFDYERELSAKESCKYGEYGLFEHLLFLSYVVVVVVVVLFLVDVRLQGPVSWRATTVK